jgi:hypothetical protein
VFEQGRVRFGYNQPSNPNYERMLADFWKYLEDKDRYRHIRYYQILGGEPFFQPEFDTSLDFWESHPNPELNIQHHYQLESAHKEVPCVYRSFWGNG